MLNIVLFHLVRRIFIHQFSPYLGGGMFMKILIDGTITTQELSIYICAVLNMAYSRMVYFHHKRKFKTQQIYYYQYR